MLCYIFVETMIKISLKKTFVTLQMLLWSLWINLMCPCELKYFLKKVSQTFQQ